MKLKSIVFATSLLIVQLLSAQNGWPKKILIGKDTIIGFTPVQLHIINYVRADKIFYKRLSDTLKANTTRQAFVIDQQDQLINIKTSELVTKSAIINNLKVINLDYEKLNKKNEHQILWLKVQRNTLAAVVIVAAVKIFIIK